MFDLEHGDRVADSLRHTRSRRDMRVSRAQLLQLTQAARANAEREEQQWQTQTRNKLVNEIIEGSSTSFARFLRRLVGSPIARTHEEAQAVASQQMAQFRSWQTNWRATEAKELAVRWFGAASTLTTFDGFDLPADDYADLLEWAAQCATRATSEPEEKKGREQ